MAQLLTASDYFKFQQKRQSRSISFLSGQKNFKKTDFSVSSVLTGTKRNLRFSWDLIGSLNLPVFKPGPGISILNKPRVLQISVGGGTGWRGEKSSESSTPKLCGSCPKLLKIDGCFWVWLIFCALNRENSKGIFGAIHQHGKTSWLKFPSFSSSHINVNWILSDISHTEKKINLPWGFLKAFGLLQQL